MEFQQTTINKIVRVLIIVFLTPLFVFVYASPFIFLRSDIVMDQYVAVTLAIHIPIIILTAYVSIKRTWTGIFGFETKQFVNRFRVPGIFWTTYIFIKQTWAGILGFETKLLINGYASKPFVGPVSETILSREHLRGKKKIMGLVIMT